MLLSLFKSQPFLDESTTNWIIDTYAWALEQFDAQFFKETTQLILPTGDFYPDKVSSIDEMAASVFEKTLNYAGMAKWPIKLISPANYQQNPQLRKMPKLSFESKLRGETVIIHSDNYRQGVSNTIYVSFNPNQINQPQDLIASFAQAFAAIIIVQRGVEPPGGEQFMPQAVDLLANFMGFGVMFANTAYQFKGGCGSCYNKYANREVAFPRMKCFTVWHYSVCLKIFLTAKLQNT